MTEAAAGGGGVRLPSFHPPSRIFRLQHIDIYGTNISTIFSSNQNFDRKLQWGKSGLKASYLYEVLRSVRMVAEEASPVLRGAVVLEHVEESVRAQLVQQSLLLLKVARTHIGVKQLQYRTCLPFNTFALGNAPVTSVTKEMFSALSISQQCLSALTEDSRVLSADPERAWWG